MPEYLHKSSSAKDYKYVECPRCHRLIRGTATFHSAYSNARGGKEGTIGSLVGQVIGLFFGLDPNITKQTGRLIGMVSHYENSKENGTEFEYYFTCPSCGESFCRKDIAEIDTVPDEIIEKQHQKYIAAEEKRRNRSAVDVIIWFIFCALGNLYTKLTPRYTIVGTEQKKILFITQKVPIKDHDTFYPIMLILAIIALIGIIVNVITFLNCSRRMKRVQEMNPSEFRASKYRGAYEAVYEKDSDIFLSKEEKYPPIRYNSSSREKIDNWAGKHVIVLSIFITICTILSCYVTFQPNKKPVDLTQNKILSSAERIETNPPAAEIQAESEMRGELEAVEDPIAKLHPSVADFTKSYLILETSRFRIRIDGTNNGMRYAAWRKPDDFSQKPSLVVNGGKYWEEDILQSPHYRFVNYGYEYMIIRSNDNDYPYRLEVRKDGKIILQDGAKLIR